jgi:acetolactate synthase small subunit
MKKDQFVLTIKAEDRPGLLHLVTGVIEKKIISIKSLSYAPTDIHDIILITIEVTGNESDLAQVALKIENIIEVFAVEVKKYNSAVCLRAAYFKMAKTFLESPKAIAMSNYDTVMVNIYPDAILLAKYGTDATIQKLYNALDGPQLLGFSQTGLISESDLIQHDAIERIIGLAA